MERPPVDEIRRYHPSVQEQNVLTPNLKQYFSYPERSPDRSRIACEVSNELSKISNHWTNRAVRLWFNNNKKLVDSTSTDTGTEPEVHKGMSSTSSGGLSSISNSGQPTSNSSSGSSDQTKDISESSGTSTPDTTPSQNMEYTIANKLKQLEDEAVWCSYGSKRMQEIISQYNSICLQDPAIVNTTATIKSSNYIEFPSPPAQIMPFAIVDLLNKSDENLQRQIWCNRNKRTITIPSTEVNTINNGYAAYVYEQNGAKTLSYVANPEYSTEWKSMPIRCETRVSSLTIGSMNSAWAISDKFLIRVLFDTQQQVMSVIPGGPLENTCIVSDKNFICFSASNHNTLYLTNDQMSIFPVQVLIPCSGITDICLLGGNIVCGISQSTICSLVDKTGKEIRPFIGHRNPVTHISKITDSIFCTCSSDNSIKLWDSREPRAVATFFANGATPTTLTSSSNYIVSGYDDSKLRTFDIRHKQAKALLGVEIERQTASNISFNEKLDALTMFTYSNNEERFWRDSPDMMNKFTIMSPFIKSDK